MYRSKAQNDAMAFQQKHHPNKNKNELSSRDLIYLFRSALNINTAKGDPSKNEDILLEYIKEKDWNWFSRDIDSNILLTYPIYNGAFKIVKYLLENKYNLKEYNKLISSAISSGVNIRSPEMLKYILSLDINQEYINDCLIRAYSLKNKFKSTPTTFDKERNDEILSKYKYLIDLLMEKSDFKKVVGALILRINSEDFHEFIFNHKEDNTNKIEYLNKEISEFLHFDGESLMVKEKLDILEKYKVYCDLNRMPINSSRNIKNIKL